jgi:OFA family oxalate/formate antiporter-like MFS transporter
MLFALAAVFGFGSGATSPIRMSMIPEFFGVRSVGAIMGIVGAAWAVGGITGPILAGYIFDLSNSYDMAFLVGGLLMITGMAATYFLKVPDG